MNWEQVGRWSAFFACFTGLAALSKLALQYAGVQLDWLSGWTCCLMFYGLVLKRGMF